MPIYPTNQSFFDAKSFSEVSDIAKRHGFFDVSDVTKRAGLMIAGQNYTPIGTPNYNYSAVGDLKSSLGLGVDPTTWKDKTIPEVKSEVAQSIMGASRVGGITQGIGGAISSGVQLLNLLKNPLPSLMRPQSLQEVSFNSSVEAVGGALDEMNRQGIASGLNMIRSQGSGSTEGLVAAGLNANLGIAGEKAKMITEATNQQTMTNANIRAQNAQMALDYGAYKDDYRRAERDRKDIIRASLINTMTSIPASIIQSSADAKATIASMYTGGGI